MKPKKENRAALIDRMLDVRKVFHAAGINQYIPLLAAEFPAYRVPRAQIHARRVWNFQTKLIEENVRDFEAVAMKIKKSK